MCTEKLRGKGREERGEGQRRREQRANETRWGLKREA